MAALPLQKAYEYDPELDDQPDELPTNQLHSSRLHSVPLNAGTSDVEQSNVIDWVGRLSTTQSVRVPAQRPTLTLLPPPTGMIQHSTPARMVPARGGAFGAVLKKTFLFLLLPSLVIGSAAWGVVTYFGTEAVSEWAGGIFAPAPAQEAPGTDSTIGGDLPTFPDAQTEPGPPSVQGNALELRDRGIELFQQGDYPEAIRYLEGAANTGLDDALSYYQLGLAYLAVTGRPHSIDDAELAFRTTVSLQPDWAAAHRMLAESLVRGGYFEEAIGPALEATRLDPALGEAWLTLSRAYKGAGRDAEATQAYAEATRLSPAPPLGP